ncbi:polyribonucleotide nucleotidyltransferase 1 [Aphelenchoides avenae]|nr:polyribonucleotide nucleotidyltransferase 1 [Aphelenchus avenae]
MARFTDGAVVVSEGDNAVLATVVTAGKPGATGGLPGSEPGLMVDFKQSAAAVGRIPTNYLRREMTNSDMSILAGRIVDRSLRPFFRNGYTFNTQVICKPLSLDETGDGVVLGLNAASAAVNVSPIPVECPVAASRVALVEGNIVVNPSRRQLRESTMDLFIAGTSDDRVVMIEMDGKEISMDIFLESVRQGMAEVAQITAGIQRLRSTAGKKKFEFTTPEVDEGLVKQIRELSEDRLYYVFTDSSHDKISRDMAVREIREQTMSALRISYEDTPEEVLSAYFERFVRQIMRQLTIDSGVRCDGRGVSEFRPISIEVDVFKKLHGSAIFQRGQSQVLGTVTFDSPQAAFHPDSVAQLLGAQQKKMFMLHYEFPQFAINQISTGGGSNRRELGHGALAEKSLKHLIPHDFPYSVRVACQVLESNGSTSMASACVGSLALFDAGVPLKSHVGGVAIGLFADEADPESGVVLTDLSGIEDYGGHMDFKIAGTPSGFTAMQMDLKISGLSMGLLKKSLDSARKGLDHVLEKMNAAISRPRPQFKPTVPVIDTMPMPTYKRNILFKSGGYHAKSVEVETSVKVSIEDDGTVSLLAPNREKLAEAKEMISRLVEENTEVDLTFGAIYNAEVTEVRESGVMVLLKKDTRPIFLRNSELAPQPVKHASALGLKIGDRIKVQYFGRDQTSGAHRISRKALMTTAIRTQNLLGPESEKK